VCVYVRVCVSVCVYVRECVCVRLDWVGLDSVLGVKVCSVGGEGLRLRVAGTIERHGAIKLFLQ